jgi:hypothetical protein
MANYTIIGSDGKEYSLVSGDDLRKWIAEGRLDAQSLVKAESDAEFRPLSAFPEFADAFGHRPTSQAAPSLPPADGDRAVALQAVKGPAIALIITASLGILYYASSAILNLFFGGMMFQSQMPSNVPPQMQEFIQNMRGPMAGVISLVIAAVNGFVLFGAIKLLRLQNFGLVMAAVIVAMLPCQCCCLLGLPFGIWALVMINKTEVKSHFR